MRTQYDDNGPRPDVTEVVAQVSDTFRRNARNLGPLVAGLLVLVVLATGIYSVGPGELGVVRTFGKVDAAPAGPGLHYAWPFVQQVDVVNVEEIRRLEVGFRGEKKEISEARMLTGDENLVEVRMIVQYRVSDPIEFLFRIDEPAETLRATAEVALRTVVGHTTIDDLMTRGRERVQDEAGVLLQELINQYHSGLVVTQVKLLQVEPPEQVRDAFDDVVRAREEKEKLINKARAYRADKIPRARGEAEQLKQEAEAYQARRIKQARGDASRFEQQFAEYDKAKEVTRERLYLETMERILGRVEKKVVVDDGVAGNALPLLPLAPQAAAAAAGAK